MGGGPAAVERLSNGGWKKGAALRAYWRRGLRAAFFSAPAGSKPAGNNRAAAHGTGGPNRYVRPGPRGDNGYQSPRAAPSPIDRRFRSLQRQTLTSTFAADAKR